LPYPQFTPEKAPPPALPKGVKKWLIHQTCEKGNGAEYGVASHYVDLDRWNGNEAAVRAYFGYSEQSFTLEQKVERLWNAHRELW